MAKMVSLDNLLANAAVRRAEATPWLGALIGEATEKFAHVGLPNRRNEAWRYSDLSKALHEATRSESEQGAAPTLAGACVAAFENGVLDESQSTYGAMGARSLRQVLAENASPFASIIGRVNGQPDHPIINLNTALMEEGLVLRVPADVTLATPLHLRFNWRGGEPRSEDGRHLRILVVLEDGARATLFESHDGAPGFATVVTEVRLAAAAKLTHIRLENFTDAARQTAATLGEIGEKALYRGFYFSQGGHFARHEALLKLAGEEAHVGVDAAYMVADRRHCDNTTIIEHASPNTTSNQVFRGVLAGSARGVYQGCVKVAKGAQKTDARQLSRAMLLSHKAEIITKPELEIFADDVKCSHGATAGELDASALFFLRARGIPEAEARAMLVEAFLVEAMDAVESEAMRGLVANCARLWMRRHAGEASHVE